EAGLTPVRGGPPWDGRGPAGGFKVMTEGGGDPGLETLESVSQEVVRRTGETAGLREPFTSFRANTPWLDLDIDRTKAKMLGVSMSEVFSTLQLNLGSLYINDFNRFGRTWQVIGQAKADFRDGLEHLRRLKVRNAQGRMVPLATLAKVRDINGPTMIVRYNMYQAAAVNGRPAAGVSSGQAIGLMEGVVRDRLARGMRFEWTE